MDTEKRTPPNFIVFLVDDQGWNGTSVQMMNKESLSKSDYHETPNLEILAQNGIKFSKNLPSNNPISQTSPPPIEPPINECTFLTPKFFNN